MKNELMITPRTKVLELLNHYPKLETKLIELVPAFSKLKNPLLRKTIARVTTLQQAAAVGETSVEKLINILRADVGQDKFNELPEQQKAHEGKPSWVDGKNIKETFDARPVLAKGGHPLEKVLADIRNLGPGSIYLFITPFFPAPLIERIDKSGYENWSEQKGNLYYNYVRAM